jgi:hypothetical protein
MADWYDTRDTSPDAASSEEYRDWVAENVDPETAEAVHYGEGGS